MKYKRKKKRSQNSKITSKKQLDALTTEKKEIQKQIAEYQSQLDVVESALVEDPNQPEFVAVRNGLLDVLTITKDLLQLKKETEVQIPTYHNLVEVANSRGIYVGMKCEAIWNEDKNWYKATVNSISEKGFSVTFQEYGNTQNVGPDAIRHIKVQDVVMVEHTKKGGQVTSKNVLVVDKDTGELVLPANLKILPTDPEHIRKNKRKGTKALKSEQRKIVTEDTRNKRKNDWDTFQKKGKVSAKKIKTESIFQSPETVDGKVGVTGSGQKMTSFSTQKYEPKKLQSSLPVGTKKPVGEA